MIEKTDDQTRLGKYVPTNETKDKAFQEDSLGNFRIIIEGKSSEWKNRGQIAILKVHDKTYIGVTYSYDGDLPKKCVLRVEIVDEDGETDFYKFKIVDLISDSILNADDVIEIFQGTLFSEDGYTFNIKDTKLEGFIKMAMTTCEDIFLERIMTRKEIEEYLKNALPSGEFDVINEEGEKINRK